MAKEKGLSVKGQFTQADVPAMLDKVNAQIASLVGDNEKKTRIDVPLDQFGKISDIKDVNTLRGAYAYVTKKMESVDSYNDVFTALHPLIKLGSFKIGGFTLEKWQEEIKTQFASVTFEEKLNKLKKVKEELEKNLSEEQKLANSMNNIADMLSSVDFG